MALNREATPQPGRYTSTCVVMRLSALGDVAIALPLLYTACHTYRLTRFVLVTSPLAAGLVQNAPANLEVFPADVKKKYIGLKGLRRLTADLLTQYRPEVMVDLHDVLRTKVVRTLALLHGVKVTHIHKERFDRYLLTRPKNKRLQQLTPSIMLYKEALGRYYQETAITRSVYDGPGQAPVESYRAITGRAKAAGEQWIGVAPYAAHRGKVYPLEQMFEVVKQLSRADGTRTIYLFGGGGDEAAALDRWAATVPGVVTLAGKRYGFAAELALINHIDVMVSMDSANMHLASMVHTPVVSIWGATSPLCGFYGWQQNPEYAVELPMDCRPCSVFGSRACRWGDYRCLSGITPRMIVDRVDMVLNKAKAPVDPKA